MKALTYIEHGNFALIDKPVMLNPKDAVDRVIFLHNSAYHNSETHK